jgi:hypothetical protein
MNPPQIPPNLSVRKVSRPRVGNKADSLKTRAQKRRHIRAVIDEHGFNWLVWEVAASGFFTDSYNLFATNVILPSLAFVYWPDDDNSWRETLINCMTLGGSLVGQLAFGYLADRMSSLNHYAAAIMLFLNPVAMAESDVLLRIWSNTTIWDRTCHSSILNYRRIYKLQWVWRFNEGTLLASSNAIRDGRRYRCGISLICVHLHRVSSLFSSNTFFSTLKCPNSQARSSTSLSNTQTDGLLPNQELE